MKKFSCLVLTSFLSISAFAENGKWFDFGNGIINLNTVNRITSESICDVKYNGKDIYCNGIIKFDNFSLTVFTSSSKGKNKKDKYEDAQDKVKDVMSEIRDFLDDDDTYSKL